MKSHVTVEQKVCPICRETFDSGAILLDRRMRETFEHYTTTGFDQCKKCIAMNEDGYIALVGVSNSPSGDTLKPEDADYSKEYLWLKRFVAEQIFDWETGNHPFVFIEPEAITKVKEIVAAQIKENENERTT